LPATSRSGRSAARFWPACAAVLALWAASAATHRSGLDGPRGAFLAAHLLSATAALALLALVALPALRSRRGSGRRSGAAGWGLALLAAGAALLPPAVHGARLLNRDIQLARALESPLRYGAVVAPTLYGSASLEIDPAGELALRVPAGSTGFFQVHRPDLGAHAGPLAWAYPRALAHAEHPLATEEVGWRAAVERSNRYFIVLDAEPLLVQVVPWGIIVHVDRGPGRLAEQTLPLVVENGRPADWSYAWSGGRGRLRVDGRQVWEDALPAPRVLRLGETRTDAEHGGTLRLSGLRYARHARHARSAG
jgi:hypothetical protein